MTQYRQNEATQTLASPDRKRHFRRLRTPDTLTLTTTTSRWFVAPNSAERKISKMENYRCFHGPALKRVAHGPDMRPPIPPSRSYKLNALLKTCGLWVLGISAVAVYSICNENIFSWKPSFSFYWRFLFICRLSYRLSTKARSKHKSLAYHP